jgi:hypothetical protein
MSIFTLQDSTNSHKTIVTNKKIRYVLIPIFVAAPTLEVAIPAINTGVAAPAEIRHFC